MVISEKKMFFCRRFAFFVYFCAVKQQILSFRTFFLSLLIVFGECGQSAVAATVEGGQPTTNLFDSVEIGLITCSPHDEVYSLYGHTALRWHDLRTGEDLVFNYGIFNFNKPYFVLRFVFGLTDYELGIAPTKPFLRYYERWGCEVTEQLLNLTASEKLRLTMALHENAQPENRVYRYNFFFDNCATRPRDMVERNVDGKVEYMPRPDYDVSFREMVRQQTRHYPWGTFGNDILLGLRADMKTTQREQEFLPANLRHDFDRATIVTDGQRRPLVLERRQLLPPGVQVEGAGFPLRPLMCALLLLAVSLCVFAYEQMKHKVLRWFDVVLMLLMGLAGCVLFVMLFSEHPATTSNLQVLLLNPLPLFFIWQVARGRRSKWFAIQAVLTLLFCVGGLWQSYAEGMYIVALCQLLRFFRHYHDKK